MDEMADNENPFPITPSPEKLLYTIEISGFIPAVPAGKSTGILYVAFPTGPISKEPEIFDVFWAIACKGKTINSNR